MSGGGTKMGATVTREVPARRARKRRRTVRNGEPADDLVSSAHAGGVAGRGMVRAAASPVMPGRDAKAQSGRARFGQETGRTASGSGPPFHCVQ